MNLKQPTTSVIELRCDLRSLASIGYYFNELRKTKGTVIPSSKGGLASASVKLLAEILIKSKVTKDFSSTEEATEFLQSLGYSGSFNRNRQNMQSLSIQVAAEGLIEGNLNLEDPEETISSEDILKNLTKKKE